MSSAQQRTTAIEKTAAVRETLATIISPRNNDRT
jgi:hypothetical protein